MENLEGFRKRCLKRPRPTRIERRGGDAVTRWVLLLLLLAAFVGGIAGTARAEEEISLEQSLEIFYRNNYDILITRYEVDKAQADYVGARLRPNPVFSVNQIGLDFHRPVPRQADESQLSIRIDQLFETAGKRELRSSAALANWEASKLSYKDNIRALLVGFFATYYNLQLGELNLDFSRYELARFDRILDIAERRHNAGFLTLLDLSKIKLAKIDIENNQTNFFGQFRKDIESFNFLLARGEAAWKPFKLTPREAFPEFTEEALVERAYQTRYDLAAAQKQIEAAKHSMALAKALRTPDFIVGVEQDRFGMDNVVRYGGGIGVALPIFNRAQGEILRRSAEFNQAEEQIKKVRRQIVSDVRQSLVSYQSSVKVFETYRARRQEMEDLLNKSEAAFSLGGITVLDLLDTRRTYRDFITKYNQAFVQALLNQELLKIYTGEIR